ncbi:MFS transporter [Aquirufa sp. HETE-40SA]
MEVRFGLKENWQQFSLLVLVNAFVGGMVGLERSILPQLAAQEFHIASHSAIFSFIVVFGIVKALTNYFAGHFANALGRRRLLIFGWLFAIPIPFLLMWAPTWNWIVAANVLLGINQGLAWSSTVTMKIDLVGDKQRGLAMGINEFAGYLSVGLVALLTAWIANAYGIRPYPFYIGIVFVFLGLLISWIWVKDTRSFVQKASQESTLPLLKNPFWDTSLLHRNLGAISQAGLVNNLNDGMIWGLFPLLLATKGFDLGQIGIITAIYPLVWGLAQLGTGRLSDFICQKDLLFIGMLLQAFAILGLIWAQTFAAFAILSFVIGIGTAIVYPTFLASIAENTHPADRAASLGTFRLWRDLGYAFGAILTGILADYFELEVSVIVIGLLTLGSAGVIKWRMIC